MGRQKKLEAEKKLEGNRGKREIAGDPEIQPILDYAPPMGMEEQQVKYWNKYAPYMVKNKYLTDLNITDLESLCYFEAQRENIRKMLTAEGASLLQEKKNYHGDVVDLIEGVYSKLSRNYEAIIRVLKADLRIRTDKLRAIVAPKKAISKFDGLINGGK